MRRQAASILSAAMPTSSSLTVRGGRRRTTLSLAPGASDNVVRLLPPLTVSEEEVGIAADKIEAACRRIEAGLAAAPVKGAAE